MIACALQLVLQFARLQLGAPHPSLVNGDTFERGEPSIARLP